MAENNLKNIKPIPKVKTKGKTSGLLRPYNPTQTSQPMRLDGLMILMLLWTLDSTLNPAKL